MSRSPISQSVNSAPAAFDEPAVARVARLQSIDFLRGVVVIVMALDHARDYWAAADFDPTDLQRTYPAIFLTRIVTHVCAPVFVLLAGVSARLMRSAGRSTRDVSLFLFTRGLWLIVLEILVINPSWQFDFNFVVVQVIWVLGWSMVVLAGLIWLPAWSIAGFAGLMLLGHNALDGIRLNDVESLGWLWAILHVPSWIPLGGNDFGLVIYYPLVPWIGLMPAGYLLGSVFEKEPRARRSILLGLGLGLCLVFVVLRFANGYGDPNPWSVQDRGALFSFLSFINVTKYPASLFFIAMTLGPALLLLARAESWSGRQVDFFAMFGRVALFFYLLHIPLLNLAAHGWSWLVYGTAVNFFDGPDAWPIGYTTSLPMAYLAWAGVVLLLYWPCSKFAELKASRRSSWLSYF